MKTRFWILPCLLFILVLSLAACGEESPNITPEGPPESVHPFIYVVNEDEETCTIRGVGDITTSKVTIPEELDGYRVTFIAGQAFQDCDWISSIVFPKTLEKIGAKAFENCTSIKNIYIDDVAVWCDLEGVKYIPSSVENLYVDGEPATELVIPNGVTKIPSYAFSSFDNIESVTIPSSVTELEEYAFSGCKNLASISLPNSVTKLGEGVFYNCENLKNITLPNHILEISGTLFSGCSQLAQIAIPDSVTRISDRAFYGCISLTSVTVPNNVTTIGYSVFYDCEKLESITLPFLGETVDDTYGNISKLFNGIGVPDSLKSVTLTGGSQIGLYAFSECSHLTNITLPDGLVKIGSGAFQDCTALTNINIPNSVTEIGSYAFQDCTALTNINIPNSVTEIGSHAFQDCTSLTRIYIPNGVTELNSGLFRGCGSLTEITYNGTKAQWKNIDDLYTYWYEGTNDFVVVCTDGTLTKEEATK